MQPEQILSLWSPYNLHRVAEDANKKQAPCGNVAHHYEYKKMQFSRCKKFCWLCFFFFICLKIAATGGGWSEAVGGVVVAVVRGTDGGSGSVE